MTKTNWYIYQISPIDFGFRNLKTLGETFEELSRREADGYFDSETYDCFLRGWLEARKLLSNYHGGLGKLRQSPSVFWLPRDFEFAFGFVYKFDNNGDTYVISPFELPWLVSVSFSIVSASEGVLRFY